MPTLISLFIRLCLCYLLLPEAALLACDESQLLERNKLAKTSKKILTKVPERGVDCIKSEIEELELTLASLKKSKEKRLTQLQLKLLKLELATIDTSLDNICPIGFVKPVSPAITPCNHIFEESAIILWLTKKETCPMCNRKLTQEDLRNRKKLLENIKYEKAYFLKKLCLLF